MSSITYKYHANRDIQEATWWLTNTALNMIVVGNITIVKGTVKNRCRS